MDRSQLVATSGGAARPLGVAGLAVRRLSPGKPVTFLYSSGLTEDNSVCGVSHEKVTTHGVKTSGVRTLSGRSEL